jgi:hypothetical protein
MHDSWLFYPLADCPPHGSSSMDDPPNELTTVMFIHQNGMTIIFRIIEPQVELPTKLVTNCLATTGSQLKSHQKEVKQSGHQFWETHCPKRGGQTVWPPVLRDFLGCKGWTNSLPTIMRCFLAGKWVAIQSVHQIVQPLWPIQGGRTICTPNCMATAAKHMWSNSLSIRL